MNDDELNTLLRRSAARSVSDVPGVAAELRRVTEGTSASRTRSRRRRNVGLAIPLLLAPVAAFGLSAATEARMVPDLVIPVSFTADTGDEVGCSIEFFNGELAWVEVNSDAVDYLERQDWSTIGQDMYDRAESLVQAGDPEVLAAAEAYAGEEYTAYDQWRSAWAIAEHELVLSQIPGELLLPAGLGSDSDCMDKLP